MRICMESNDRIKDRPYELPTDFSMGFNVYISSSGSMEEKIYEADNETDDEGDDISWGFLEGG